MKENVGDDEKHKECITMLQNIESNVFDQIFRNLTALICDMVKKNSVETVMAKLGIASDFTTEEKMIILNQNEWTTGI